MPLGQEPRRPASSKLRASDASSSAPRLQAGVLQFLEARRATLEEDVHEFPRCVRGSAAKRLNLTVEMYDVESVLRPVASFALVALVALAGTFDRRRSTPRRDQLFEPLNERGEHERLCHVVAHSGPNALWLFAFWIAGRYANEGWAVVRVEFAKSARDVSSVHLR